jgi:hypothetical protein
MGKACATDIARQIFPPFVSETPAETRGDRIDDDCFVFSNPAEETLFVEHPRLRLFRFVVSRPEEDDDDFIQERPSPNIPSTAR